MGVEKLGLRHAAIAAFAIPPTRSVAVEDRTARSLNRDVLSLDWEQRTRPLLVPPGRCPLEDDLSARSGG